MAKYAHSAAVAQLKSNDVALGLLLDVHTVPEDFRSLGERPLSLFHSLCKTIVYQQLAGKAAKTIFDRFVKLFVGEDAAADAFPTPAEIVSASVEKLRTAGLSERKASYIQDLARRVASNELELHRVHEMDDDEIARQLIAVKGIGPWTVDMFLIFQMDRKDVLPVGDLGVQKGVQSHFKLRSLPTKEQMIQLTEPWRPYRSIGSYLMWAVKDSQLPTSDKPALTKTTTTTTTTTTSKKRALKPVKEEEHEADDREPPKKRGRKSAAKDEEPKAAEETVAKKRGRRPAVAAADPAEETAAPKRRGRKVENHAESAAAESETAKRSRK